MERRGNSTERMREEIERQKRTRQPDVSQTGAQDAEMDDVVDVDENIGDLPSRHGLDLPNFNYDNDFADLLDNAVLE